MGGGGKRREIHSLEWGSEQLTKDEEGQWWGDEWGFSRVGWSHTGHVSVSVEMCVTLPLDSFLP